MEDKDRKFRRPSPVATGEGGAAAPDGGISFMPQYRSTPRELIDTARDLRKLQTVAETRLWKFLRQRQLNTRIRRQHAIGSFVLDFYAPAVRAAIEIDGATHDDEFAIAQDAIRTEWLEMQGVRVLRFRNDEVMEDVGRVLDRIEIEVRARQK